MIKKIQILGAIALATSSVAVANITLLENVDFSNGTDPWNAGANGFANLQYGGYIGYYNETAPFTAADRITPSGDGFIFSSWDDEKSTIIQSNIVQTWNAGPPGTYANETFTTGDVIVFKGEVSATKSGATTTDIFPKVFIKVLGYNELGWEFQTKAEYSDIKDVGPTLEPFELTITFPDLLLDTSLQVVQMGFEIETFYDASTGTMDSGTIFFKNLEGYIVSDEVATWAGYELDGLGWADTTPWMGFLNAAAAPWIWSASLNNWLYIDEGSVTNSGSWVYVTAP